MLNNKEIVDVYKALLNREPEDDKIITKLSTSTISQIINHCINSEEFKKKFLEKNVFTRTVVFVHIEKTAGTFIREQWLYSYFSQRYYFDNNKESKTKCIHRFNDPRFSLRYPLISGHMFLREYLAMNFIQPRIFITVIRDPLDRVISYYNFLKFQAPKHPLEKLVQDKTLYELLSDTDNSFYHAINNWQLNYLKLNSQEILKMKDSDKIIIGKQEHINEFVSKVAQAVSIPARTKSKTNVTKQHVSEEKHYNKAIKLLKDLLEPEYRLYNNLKDINEFNREEYKTFINSIILHSNLKGEKK